MDEGRVRRGALGGGPGIPKPDIAPKGQGLASPPPVTRPTDAAPNCPLWEAMHCAWSPHREPGQWRLGYAAELRAIAEEVPRAAGLLSLTPTNIDTLVRWLYTEAARAEPWK